jgi:hypothetical protein
MVSAREATMKNGKAKWLGLLLAAGAAICWLPTPANAQDDARELYRKMYEGGLITKAAYEQTTGESAPAVKSTASIDTVAVEGISGESGNAIPDSTEQVRHRSLNAEGIPATVEQFRQAKREKLSARIPSLFDRQRAHKHEAERIAKAQNMPIRFEQKDGAACELMAMENGHPIFYTTHNIKSADTIGTDEVWPGGSLGISLSGTNCTLGMWDGGAVRTTHVEFAQGGGSRVIRNDAYANYTQYSHPSSVAGTLVASGVNTNAKGMAYQSILLAHTYDYDLAEMAAAIISNDLRISNHSYGINSGWNIINRTGTWEWIWYGDPYVNLYEDYKFGFYSTNYSREIDQTAYEANTYLPVWSSGNEWGTYNWGPAGQPVTHLLYINGSYVTNSYLSHNSDGAPDGYDLIPPHGVAKNALTVGAVSNIVGGYSSPANVFLASFSSVGPTDDGRIKPDLVAQGVNLFTTHNTGDSNYLYESGTSFSAPSVAGSLTLLRQCYDEVRGTNRALLASTLKGLAIHTADECGTAGPDYSFGWGLMNTPAAAQLITNDLAGDGHSHIKEVALPDGETITIPVLATNSQPLKVTICWTDPPGPMLLPSLNPTNLVLINDLDLRLIGPSGTTNFPWVLNPASPSSAATTGDNFRDNVEQVLIASPVDGMYSVKVNHKGALSNGWQDVSILISGNLPLEKPELAIVDVNRLLAPTNTLEWPSVVGQFYRVQSTTSLIDGAWTDLTGDISALRTNIVYGAETNPEPDVLFFRVNEVP